MRATPESFVVCALVLLVGCGCAARAEAPEPPPQQQPQQPQQPQRSQPRWSVRMADSVLARHPDPATIGRRAGRAEPKWDYASSFAAYAVAQVGLRTGQVKYLDYARRYMDAFVDGRGAITTATYKPSSFKLDDIAPGRVLLLLHRQTGEQRWLTAADALADQLRRQPRTADGGFWHKQIYPHQMWLDGIYMACPFMADYARAAGDGAWADEAAGQILTIARHTHDPRTGLYFHGWDESRAQRWADPKTGTSSCFWGRAVGWYAMGIVDTLESLPADHPRRGELLDVLKGLADALARVQDADTGLWYQVLDQRERAGNYPESSASCMFVYALAKAARLGYLDPRFATVARKGYAGILARFVETDPTTGQVHLKDTCRVAGLGGNPYRDGSYDYYVHEPRATNDPKGVAPFILASLEMQTH
jgi:unsaturated rhamnogalacturonyl hydrolase